MKYKYPKYNGLLVQDFLKIFLTKISVADLNILVYLI